MTAAQSILSEDALGECARLLPDDPAAAAAQLALILKDDPLNADAYRLLAKAKEAVRRAGLHAGDVRSATVSVAHSRLAQAARSLQASDLPTAEIILRARLLDEPTDVHALRMMADLGFRLGLEGEPLLHYALELEPAFTAATLDLAKQRYLHNRYEEALVLIDEVLARDPGNESALYMKGVVLGHAGRFEEAIDDLSNAGRATAGAGAAVGELRPLARPSGAARRNRRVPPRRRHRPVARRGVVEPVRPQDGALRRRRHRGDGSRRCGRALARRTFLSPLRARQGARNPARSARAFGHYAEGNRLHREQIDYDPDEFTDYVTAAKRALHAVSSPRAAARAARRRDPIFILGMPRAGSTLIEQILASHPQIEGTMELPDIPALAKGLGGRSEVRGRAPIPRPRGLDADALRALGEDYLERTRS